LKVSREGETQHTGDAAKRRYVKQDKRSAATTKDVKDKDIGGFPPPDIVAYKVSNRKL